MGGSSALATMSSRRAGVEFVEVANVGFPVDLEHTRRTLLQLFGGVSAVDDIVVDVRQERAMVCFAESAAAQCALVKLDRFPLFGRELSLRIGPPPASQVPGYIVTTKPTAFLLVRNSPYVVVVVKLKHVAGVVAVTSAGVNCCFVVAASAEDAVVAKGILQSHRSRWGTEVSVSHLRRLA